MRNLSSYTIPTDNEIEYEEENDSADENEDNLDHNFAQNGYFYNRDDSKRHPKKRKLESFVSNSEFAPSRSRRDTWSEEDSLILLEIWGERYMESGRRSLRAEDWTEVTEKVLESSGVERTVVECRSQLDVMKNKYKKERAKVESGIGSNWAFFKKMDVLLNSRMRGHSGLGCGIDSGEYVFMNPQVYLERSNLLDEMRDSPVQSDEDNEDEDEDEEEVRGQEDNGESARLLAESIQRFGQVYEKVEENKRKQIMDLEKTRQNFQRDLELQKKQIVERAQAEIAKIREIDDDDDDDDEEEDGDNTDTSVDNLGD